MFPLKEKHHNMDTRTNEKYKVQYANTERLRNLPLFTCKISLWLMSFDICQNAFKCATNIIWFNIQFAICNMQYAICNMQYAICNMQYLICNIQYSICNMQFSVAIML